MNQAVAVQDEPKQEPVALNLTRFLESLEPDFQSKLTRHVPDFSFARECEFAKQQLLKSDFAINTARSNRQSLHDAIVNVGAIGLTLSPASAYAYLVPRDKAIRLDISYRGLCKLATDTGVIKWVQAVMVYENDDFHLTGLHTPPIHKQDPFSERGAFKGVYCSAKTNEGDYLTTAMSADDIYKIRNLSKAYQSAQRDNKNNSVWHIWFDQMALKTVVKRGSKMWPVSDGSERLHTAIDVLNQQEQYDDMPAVRMSYSLDQKEALNKALEDNDGLTIYRLSTELEVMAWTALRNSFEHGEKGRMKEAIDRLAVDGLNEINKAADQLAGYFDSDDTSGAGEILIEYTVDEAELIFERASSDVVEWARGIIK